MLGGLAAGDRPGLRRAELRRGRSAIAMSGGLLFQPGSEPLYDGRHLTSYLDRLQAPLAGGFQNPPAAAHDSARRGPSVEARNDSENQE